MYKFLMSILIVLNSLLLAKYEDISPEKNNSSGFRNITRF